MHDRIASTTASIVACARGAAGVDPIAARLLPPGFAQVSRAGAMGLSPFIPLVDLMRVRTLAIDDEVTSAAREGSTQVVVLGAGLCARAWRMTSLASTTVFEVDHPATQRAKRRRLAGVETVSKDVRFVGVDFERDDLAERLEQAGHDAQRVTTWIWEGVTPYLTIAAITASLAAVRARSAAGSVLLMTYGTPIEDRAYSSRLVRSRHVLHLLAHPFLRLLGEPLEGLMSVASAHEIVTANGFVIRGDDTYMDLARRMHLRPPRPIVAERLLVAVAS